MSLPVIRLKIAPRLPTMPACSQWAMWLLRHDVMTDVVLGPAVFQGPFDGLDVAFGRIRRGVVPLVAVLAERDADAGRIADVVVLDDPAFAPVRTDQADLFGGGRGPGRGGVHHRQSAHGDVIDCPAWSG